MENITEQQKKDLYLRKAALGEIEGWQPTGYPSQDKPWLKYYSEEAVKAPLPNYTMYEYIYKQNQDNLKRIAMNYYGADTTYEKMFERIDQMAGCLQAAGISEGEIVTICMINGPDTVCLLFALNKIGAIANMVYGADTPATLKRHLMDAKSTVVFTLDMFQEKFASIADEANLKRIIVTNITAEMAPMTRIAAQWFKKMKPKALPEDTRFCTWKKFFEKKKVPARTCHDGETPAVITYTGGTTGGSKGVLLSSKAVNVVAQQYIASEHNYSRNHHWMQTLPLFIAYGVTCSMLLPLAIGMTQIIRIPMADSLNYICKKFKPNYLLTGPAYWEKFADDNEDIDLSFLTAVLSGGDILRQSVEKKINDYIHRHGSDVTIMNGYAMTEVAAGGTLNYPWAYRSGSVGIPTVKSVIAAFDPDTGEEMPYGEEGELCFASPSMMIGYVNNETETKKIMCSHIDRTIWVHSGDLGYVDKDGFIFVSGRLKRYFAYAHNGVHHKVFSIDIEKSLAEHPAVDNCAVVPVADEKSLQAAVAYIIIDNNYKKQTDLSTILTQYCREKLPIEQRPVKYYFVDSFPLTKIGKVDYRALEKMAEESGV